MDNNPLLEDEGGVKDDGLHTKLRHHIYGGMETRAWTKWPNLLWAEQRLSISLHCRLIALVGGTHHLRRQ